MATNTLFIFSMSPPLKFLEALFILQTTFITLSPSSTMIKSTKMISVLGIFLKNRAEIKIFQKFGSYKYFIAR